jgi:hypothetical protein
MKFFYNFYFLPFSVERVLMKANPSDKSPKLEALTVFSFLRLLCDVDAVLAALKSAAASRARSRFGHQNDAC